MDRTIRTTTIVQPGGRIELVSTDLQPGATVSVTITHSNGETKRSIAEIAAGYAGGSLFKSAADVDAYINKERDSWSR